MDINDDNEYRFVEKTLKAATMPIRDDVIAPRFFLQEWQKPLT